MKYKTFFICFLLCRFTLAISPLTLIADEPVSLQSEAENREKDSKIVQAAIWNFWGIVHYKTKNYSSAIGYFRKAAELDPDKVEYILSLVKTYFEIKKFDEAQQALNKAIERIPEKEDQKKLQIELSNVHFKWAEVLRKKYDYQNALKHFEMSHQLNKIHRPRESAIDLNQIGFVYYTFGHNQKALGYYEKALLIYHAVGERFEKATTLNNVGLAYSALGKKQKALEYYKKSLLIKRELGNHDGEAATLSNIGAVYSDFGQKQKALEYYESALTLKQQGGNRVDKAIILVNIGSVYADIKKYRKALEYYWRALPIFRELRNAPGEAATLYNIGQVHIAKNEKQNALECLEKALSLFRVVGNRYREAKVLIDLGRLYSGLNKKQKALECYQKSLPIYRTMSDRSVEAGILHNIGCMYSHLGKKREALEYLGKALPIARAVDDQLGEAAILSNIGSVYSDIGEKKKALEYYEKSLLLKRTVSDQRGQALVLNKIGNVYDDLGEIQEALDHFERVLSMIREEGDKSAEAAILNNIGGGYSALGEKRKALEYYKRALVIKREVGDPAGEANILNNIGFVYSHLGKNRKALEYHQGALSIMHKVGKITVEAVSLTNIGSVYCELGQYQKALDYYKRALFISRKLGDRFHEAAILNNIGHVYFLMGRNNKALEYYEKALPIRHAVGDRINEATTLTNIGVVYSVFGAKQKALQYYQKALPIRRDVGDRDGEALTLFNMGAAYSSLGESQKSLKYYEKALFNYQAVGNQAGEAETFRSLMHYWNDLKCSKISIFYGKQSVNKYQQLRANISGVGKDIQRSYLTSKKITYRNLIVLLIIAGRLSEAQQVLYMLKGEEYFNFIRKDRTAADALSTYVDYTQFEKQWLEEYNAVIERLSTISSEYHILKFKKNKKEAEKKRMEELTIKLKEFQIAYEKFLLRMRTEFSRIETGTLNTDAMLENASNFKKNLEYLDEKEDSKNAALHYLVHDGRIAVILTTASSQSVKQTNINERELNLTIMNYRNLTIKLGEMMRGVDPVKKLNNILEGLIQKTKEYEKKLYDVIFKPVDVELEKYGATNLTISLDGVLRYIPLGALWDGESYLVQKYRMAIITTSSLRNIRDIPVKEKKILGLGASRGGQGFTPLPYVGREIRAIVNDEEEGYYGLIKGKGFINNDFTRDTMVKQLKTGGYPLVHISSHFKFSPGDETKNHLLLGDGTTMKLSEIRQLGKLFDNVKLLVLSACETGVGGNGEEIDGFGELAQQSGAKSVIASLWPVADESTKELMVLFYKNLKEGKYTSKIEALRQAQLKLAGLEDLLGKDKGKINSSTKSKTKYSSSYYWGPFIMIGNWR